MAGAWATVPDRERLAAIGVVRSAIHLFAADGGAGRHAFGWGVFF